MPRSAPMVWRIPSSETTLDLCFFFFFFQAEDGIRDLYVTGVQTCALPILHVAVVSFRGESGPFAQAQQLDGARRFLGNAREISRHGVGHVAAPGVLERATEIGRASCRERV